MTDHKHCSATPDPGTRRGFLKQAAAAIIGAVATIVPMAAGLLTVLDPLRKKSLSTGFLQVTSLAALADDGSPRRFEVVAPRQDAWNRSREPIGSVYLRQTRPGQVEALSVACPHAGCAVEFKPANGSFLCPCHDSKFKLDGTLADLRSPSPRAMDSLKVEVRNGTEVWVEFLTFEAGKARKVPQA